MSDAPHDRRDPAADARRAIGRVPPRPDEELPETEKPARIGDRVRPQQGMGGPIPDAAPGEPGEEERET